VGVTANPKNVPEKNQRMFQRRTKEYSREERKNVFPNKKPREYSKEESKE
jgi:hypothetical protein